MDQQSLRLILFMVIAFAILMVSQTLFGPPKTQNVPPPSAVSQGTSLAPSAASAPAAPANPAKAAPRKLATSVRKEIPPTTLDVDTPLYHAVLSNEGAAIISYELKKYRNRQTKKPLNLVEEQTLSPRPLEISFPPAGDLSAVRWEVVDNLRLLTLKNGEKGEIHFRTVSGGVEVTKTVQFQGGRYAMDVSVSVKAVSKVPVAPGGLVVEGSSDLGHEEFTGTQSRASGFRASVFSGDKMDTEKPKKNQDSKDFSPPVVWATLADQFYLAALIPDTASGAASARILRDRHPQVVSKDAQSATVDPILWVARPQITFASPGLSTGEGFTRKFTLYLGPQELEQLQSLGVRLEKALDFGMFEFISFYLLLILKWFYRWCHNWGVAVILLSVLVKLVLWWPTQHSYKSMSVNQKKMKEIQPKLDAIKKKYAGDMAKQNEETMKLYQAANINLTSGCLPMFLQIPVFIALYSALSHAIELRGAPFFLWIQDLSMSDPWHILPLVMGASMFFQQRLSAQSAPPGSAGQQKMMMWMFPIMLTFMSFQWPAGLLLYWVVTNLLSIWQQRMVNRSISNATT